MENQIGGNFLYLCILRFLFKLVDMLSPVFRLNIQDNFTMTLVFFIYIFSTAAMFASAQFDTFGVLKTKSIRKHQWF